MTEREQKLVNENMPLVYSVIHKYSVPPSDLEDLIQEAFESLCLAAKRFDKTRGTNFSTYAYHYISGRCKYFISRNALIKPVRTRESNYSKFVTYPTVEIENCKYEDKIINLNISFEDDLLCYILEKYGQLAYDIANLICQGYTVTEIAKQLNFRQKDIYAVLELFRVDENILKFSKE